MRYLFKCKKTNKIFEYECPINEITERIKKKKIKCPCCNKNNVTIVFNSVPILWKTP